MDLRGDGPTNARASAPARVTAIRWPLLLVLASLAAVAPVATDLYLPGFPEIGADLGAEASGVQLTLTSFLVGLAFGQLVMGPAVGPVRPARPLLVSAAVCVVAGVVCAVAPNLAVLVVARWCRGSPARAAWSSAGRSSPTSSPAGRPPRRSP